MTDGTAAQEAKIRTMPLSVPLTEAEVAIRAQELASAEADLDAAETQLDSAIEAAKGLKKRLELEVSDHRHAVRQLASVVRTRSETRDVPVVDRSDFEIGAVHTIRTDTGEIVATRGMTAEERQRSLFRDANAAAKA